MNDIHEKYIGRVEQGLRWTPFFGQKKAIP